MTKSGASKKRSRKATSVENGSSDGDDDASPPPPSPRMTRMLSRGESSRKAEKRAEKQKLASIASATQDPNAGIRISDPPCPTSASNDPQGMDIPTQEQASKRKKRGPTKLKKISTKTPLEVQFNDRGQPIGPNSIYLSSFLGSFAREKVPITREKWTHVAGDERDKLWSSVQEKFIIPDYHRRYVLMEIGRLWRNWKSRITKLLREAIESGATEDEINNKVKPNEVSDQEWAAFRSQRSSPQFIEKSKRFQELRSKQKYPHTMSRKGYARLEDEMKKERAALLRVQAHMKQGGQPCNDAGAETLGMIQECWDQSSSSSGSFSISKDPVAPVFGTGHQDHVRGLEFGATPSKVGGSTQTSCLVADLQRQVDVLKSKYDRLFSDFLNKEQQRRMMETDALIVQSQHGNTLCKLLDWTGSSKIVAKGKVANKDPTFKVDGIPIGPSAWMVWLSRVMDPSAFLWRPCNDMKTLGKALGDTVAWPIEFIEMADI